MARITIDLVTPSDERWDEAMLHNSVMAAYQELYGSRVKVRVLDIQMREDAPTLNEMIHEGTRDRNESARHRRERERKSA